MKESVRFFARATGRVQGVGFRFFVQQNAAALGISGWVSNMEDGSVTMQVQGAASAVEALWQKIRQGNGFIRINSLETRVLEIVPNECGFLIRH